MDVGRRAHYRGFYEAEATLDHPRQLFLIHGNCQAEALRVLFEPAVPDLLTVRMPPVHELVADDVAHLYRLLDNCAVLVSQPVADDYRGLPLGVAQLERQLPAGAVVVRIPAIHLAGLHPWQAIVRDPYDGAHDPPVVPYHDLRTLAAAAQGLDAAVPDTPTRAAVVAVGEASLAESARREQGLDVAISDLVVELGAEATWTLNHPGNALLRAVADRVLAALGRTPRSLDPGRVLLGGVRTPLEPAVVQALGLAATARDHWLIGGRRVEPEAVWSAQLAWYRTNPQIVAAGLARHSQTMSLLGLLPAGAGRP